MTRIDDDILCIHLEVALTGAPPSLLDGLTDPDRRRRHVSVGEIARHLVERLRCFDIRTEQGVTRMLEQPSLFPNDIGPISLGAD